MFYITIFLLIGTVSAIIPNLRILFLSPKIAILSRLTPPILNVCDIPLTAMKQQIMRNKYLFIVLLVFN